MLEKRRIQDIVIPKIDRAKSLNDSVRSRRSTTRQIKDVSRSSSSISAKRSLSSTPKTSISSKPIAQRKVITSKPAMTKKSFPDSGRRHSSAPQISISGAGQSSPHHVMAGLALVMVLVVVVTLFSLGTKAVIVLTPQAALMPLDTSVTVYRDPIGTQVGFDSLRLVLSETSPVTVENYEEKSERSSGTITIYNKHSTKAQRLAEETRFETPNGQIFKLGKGQPITVPGFTISDGVTTPGSVTATVFADQPGPEYNVGLTDFVIPGFRGTDKFDNFYARSIAPVEGGFIGKVPILDEDARSAIEAELRKRIAAQALQRAKEEVPQDFVFFPEAVHLEFNTPVIDVDSAGGQFIKQDAVITVALFNQDDLSRSLIEGALSGKVEGRPRIRDWSDLSVQLVNRTTDITNAEALFLKFNGQANFEWWLDYEKITNSLVGKRKKDISQSAWREHYVEQARVSLRPFWQSRYPDDSSKISLELQSY